MKEIKIKVEGMVCSGCEKRVQNALLGVDGVESVKANHEDGTVIINTNEEIDENVIKEKIEDIGFGIKEEN